jgi:ligand-binding sensor domain-containing protein
MSMKVRLYPNVLAIMAVVGGLLAGMAPLPCASPDAGKPKTWLRSGKRYSLDALEGAATRSPAGRFSALCSAREVRCLEVMNDTLWVGTEGGLYAYSAAVEAISAVAGPASISVRSIAVDERGALWIGGDHGISVRSDGKWRVFAEESLPFFARVRCMVQGEGRFWIGTYGGGCGYVVNNTLAVLSKQDSLLDERVLSIVEETPSSLCFGTASGLIEADSLGWKSLRYGSRLPIGAVKDMVFDEDGNLYLAIAGRGVAISSFGRVRTFGTSYDLPGLDVSGLSLDATGRVWAAGDAGVSIFDGSAWNPCPAPGLVSKKHKYLSIHHDSEGNAYGGTDDGTVVVISRDDVKEIAIPQPFAESCASRVRLCGSTLWLIAGRNVYSYKGAFAKTAALPGLYADEMTDLVASDAGEIWVTTRFGILHFAGRAWEVLDRRKGLPAEYFTRVARDPSGALWFATFDGGVVSLASGKWTTYGREDGLPSNAVDDLALDAGGTPWIVTRSGEVARYVQGKWARMDPPRREGQSPDASRVQDSLYQFDPSIRFLSDAASGASAPGLMKEYCICFNKGDNCLIGSRAGVYRMSATGWQTLPLPKHWAGSRPTAVIATARGDIWLGTAGNGVFVYRNGEWLRYGASTGLTDDYVRSLCEDQKGVVWIGTQSGGLTRFSPQNGM